MRNTDLVQQLARQTGVSHAEAADQLDEVVTSILKNLRKGRPAQLPGLGRLRRDLNGGLQFAGPRRGQHDKP